ncbi:hypothetical protein L6164_025741 [Bauhinia variegata]|uniref:Uncharacterized protein n=1 Tax=Bauhinia variegata TaxID=167791 RepID=A0ACB9M1U6_BAUVA|nr:hypothetical protein L6164_025741 [Bauhinia variegata]
MRAINKEMASSKASNSSLSKTSPSSQASSSGCQPSCCICPFKCFEILEKRVPFNESVERKLYWLRSQIIGADAEFDSPFGRRKAVYADHTASGRGLHFVENFIIKRLLPFYGNTHTSNSYVGSRSTKMMQEASQYIKKCLGGREDDAIMFCGSGATAAIKRLQEVMGIAVPSILRERVLETLGMEERWVVFVGPHEHHSNLLSWRQSLADVVEIGADDDGLLDMEALKLQLEAYKDSKRPMLGSFSSCSNVTGICSDTRAIAKLLHSYNGFACFDFATSGPYVEIEMKCGLSDGYDAVFLSPHKFLGGPCTPGILLMNKALYRLKSSPPSTCGGGTVNYVNGFEEKDTLYVEDIEERESGGTPQIVQIVRAALAFWVKEFINYQEIEKREQFYINKAFKRLVQNPNIKILGNLSTKRQAVMSFLVYSTTIDASGEGKPKLREKKRNTTRGKPLHGPFVAALLNDLFGIQARGGCTCAGPYGHALLNVNRSHSLAIRSAIQEGYVGIKPGWTRVSFPYYMRKEDFEFILSAVEFIATYGQRFLPLYSFNMRNGSWRLKRKELQTLSKEFSTIEDRASREYNIGTVRRNLSCFNTAKHIATRLPHFPSQRKLDVEIDPSILHFRI